MYSWILPGGPVLDHVELNIFGCHMSYMMNNQLNRDTGGDRTHMKHTYISHLIFKTCQTILHTQTIWTQKNAHSTWEINYTDIHMKTHMKHTHVINQIQFTNITMITDKENAFSINSYMLFKLFHTMTQTWEFLFFSQPTYIQRYKHPQHWALVLRAIRSTGHLQSKLWNGKSPN